MIELPLLIDGRAKHPAEYTRAAGPGGGYFLDELFGAPAVIVPHLRRLVARGAELGQQRRHRWELALEFADTRSRLGVGPPSNNPVVNPSRDVRSVLHKAVVQQVEGALLKFEGINASREVVLRLDENWNFIP